MSPSFGLLIMHTKPKMKEEKELIKQEIVTKSKKEEQKCKRKNEEQTVETGKGKREEWGSDRNRNTTEDTGSKKVLLFSFGVFLN